MDQVPLSRRTGARTPAVRPRLPRGVPAGRRHVPQRLRARGRAAGRADPRHGRAPERRAGQHGRHARGADRAGPGPALLRRAAGGSRQRPRGRRAGAAARRRTRPGHAARRPPDPGHRGLARVRSARDHAAHQRLGPARVLHADRAAGVRARLDLARLARLGERGPRDQRLPVAVEHVVGAQRARAVAHRPGGGRVRAQVLGQLHPPGELAGVLHRRARRPAARNGCRRQRDRNGSGRAQGRHHASDDLDARRRGARRRGRGAHERGRRVHAARPALRQDGVGHREDHRAARDL